jgi:serine/threonine protein kinase
MGCMRERLEEEEICSNCGFVEGTAPDSPLYLPPRTVLEGKYLVGRVLGQGGFGITYLAWDINLNIKLAIKEYFPQDLASRAAGHSQVSAYAGSMGSQYEYGLDKFLQEARTLAQFEGHPNIVSVRDFFKANGTAYFVMSYVEGITVKDHLANSGGVLPVDQARGIIMPVLDALKEVHSVNILHRDISPDNIYINQKGQIILIDFGAARQAIGEKGKSLSIILKPGYAPEEQYRSKGVQGPWTDIYAIAATHYHLVTGHQPPESLERLVNDPLELPNSFGADLSESEEKALLKALAVRAEDRFQTVDEYQSALFGDVKIDNSMPRVHQIEKASEEKSAPLPEVKNESINQQKTDTSADNYAFKINKKTISYAAAFIAIALLLYGAIALFGGRTESRIPYTEEDLATEEGTIDTDEPIAIEEGTIDTYGGTYTGQLINGMANGFGTWKHPDGDIYEGEFIDDKFNGQGTMTYANGNRYEGEFKDDLFHGQGIFTWANGDRYEGEFKDDLLNGQGTFTFTNGNRHEGEYKDGYFNGQGMFIWANGDQYEGEFIDDLFSGQGILTWVDGDRYEGDFKGDLFHGQGVYTFADGTIIEGLWENGEYLSE